METPTFDIVHSILADHSFNLDVNALVGKVHTISAKRKTISAESIQFRKCLIGFCKRFSSSRLPSLGRLLSRLPCDCPWVFPDRPNFHVKQTCDPVSNQRRFPNSGGQLQVRVGSGQRYLCGARLITLTAFRGRDGGVSTSGPPRGSDAPSSTPTWAQSYQHVTTSARPHFGVVMSPCPHRVPVWPLPLCWRWSNASQQ